MPGEERGEWKLQNGFLYLPFTGEEGGVGFLPFFVPPLNNGFFIETHFTSLLSVYATLLYRRPSKFKTFFLVKSGCETPRIYRQYEVAAVEARMRHFKAFLFLCAGRKWHFRKEEEEEEGLSFILTAVPGNGG